jgi:hypothetical protein
MFEVLSHPEGCTMGDIPKERVLLATEEDLPLGRKLNLIAVCNVRWTILAERLGGV